jgi:hypothetical protein
MSDRISHARFIPYWTLKDMNHAIKSCHNLWNKQQPMFDELYMLGVLTYGYRRIINKGKNHVKGIFYFCPYGDYQDPGRRVDTVVTGVH